MNNKIVITFLSLFVSVFAYAQAPNWQFAQIGSGAGKDGGREIAIDSEDNIYVLGGYRDYDILIQGATLTNNGDDDIFLAKYNPAGILIWIKSFGTAGSDGGRGLFIDKNDDVYVSGRFDSLTITIDTISLTNNPGGNYYFTAKFNSNGNVIWAKNSANSNLNEGLLAIDNDLNTYAMVSTPSSVNIEKYTTSDNLIWTTQLTTSGTISSIYTRGFYVDSTGVYITGGFFGNTITIGGVTLINSTAQNYDDMFIAKLDTAGNVLWAKNAINTSSDHGTKVKVDQFGNVYVLGQFSGSITFDTENITSNGNNDLFLTKYNSLGGVIWTKNAGGSENDWVSGLALDANGGAYLIGEFYGPSFTFANTTHNNLGVWFGGADIFILKYDSSGNEVWMKNIECLGYDNGNSIALNSFGEVYVTGAIEDTVGGVTNVGNFQLVSTGLDDYFFGKLATTVSVKEQNNNTTLVVYPNPTNGYFTVNVVNNSHSSLVEIYDLMGKKILEKNIENNASINLKNKPKGVYFLSVKNESRTITRKIVLQ